MKFYVGLAALMFWAGVTPAEAGVFPGCRKPEASPGTAESRRHNDPYPEEYYIAVTGKALRVEHIRDTGVWYPWDLAGFLGYDFDRTCLARCRKDGPSCAWRCGRAPKEEDDILHAVNAEGFVRTDYESALLVRLDGKAAAFRKVAPFPVYHLLIGACGLKRGVQCDEDGVLLRKWGGSWYKLADLDLVRDSQGRYFVSPFSFPREERSKIRDMIVPIKIEEHGDNCRSTEALTVGLYREMKDSPFVRPNLNPHIPYDTLCLTHGVPISRMQEALNPP